MGVLLGYETLYYISLKYCFGPEKQIIKGLVLRKEVIDWMKLCMKLTVSRTYRCTNSLYCIHL